ncbi:hypothetical protein [Candidatus Spongiihabitans sp.]|uniref:hypothetical protein n=1 Tax=Candidatus Spongiihabitans sp. TaxID=3101308 RepID=UPI003C6FAF4F
MNNIDRAVSWREISICETGIGLMRRADGLLGGRKSLFVVADGVTCAAGVSL